MPKRQLTNKDIAQLFKEGLDNCRKRFDRIDSQFNGLDSRLEDLVRGQKEIIQKLQIPRKVI